MPGSNQAFREIVASVWAERLESAVSPRVFFDEFPHLVIYVRDLPPEGGWRGVFVGDETRAGYTTIYVAQEGRIRLDKENKLVQLQLLDGTSHTTSIQAPEALDSTQFESISLALDPAIVFKAAPPKGAPEKTFAELRASIAEAAARGAPAYAERFMIQYKLAFPLTCPILALIGLALGASNHKGGRLASFVLGFGVIFIYYVLVYGFRAFAMGGRLSPEWGAWLPNVIMAAGAVVLMAWRTKAGDRPLRFTPPAFWRSRPAAAPDVSPRFPFNRAAAPRREDSRSPRERATAEASRPVPGARIQPRARPRGRIVPGYFLHLDLHRHDRQAIQGRDNNRGTRPVLFLRDSTVCLFCDSDIGARRDARDHWRDDEE